MYFQFYELRSKSEVVTFSDFRYESGDHVAVFPTNDSALVNKLGQILGVDLDVVISLNNLDGMALTEPKHLDFTSLFLQQSN